MFNSALPSGRRTAALMRSLRAVCTLDPQQMNLAAVGAQHLKAEAADCRSLAALGHAPEVVDQEPAHGVGVGVRQGAFEVPVEIGDPGTGPHPMRAIALDHDVVPGVIEIELIVEV